MKNIYIFIFLSQIVFSQTHKVTLEDKIYNAIDAFVAKPNLESLKKITLEEKNFQTKTKPEFLALVILNCNKAYFENKFSLINNAISSYEKAWQIFQKNKLENYDITEYCLKPLGNLYTIIGDFDNAENIIKQYFFIANIQNNQEQKIAAILNLSNVYQSSSKSDLAIGLLEKTIQTEKLNSFEKSKFLNNLGTNYLITKSYIKAEKILKNSIKLLKNDVSGSENLSNIYRNLSQIYRLERNFDLANSFFDKAEIALEKNKNFEPRKKAKLLYEKALLLFEQNKISESEKAIQEIFQILITNYKLQKSVLPKQNSLYAETILLDVLDLQAEISLKKSNSEQALKSFALSFYIEDLFQEILVYENSKIVAQVRNRNRTEKCIEIYYNLFKENQDLKYIETAFQLSESTKSGVLKNYICNNKTISNSEKNIREKLQDFNNVIIKEQQKLDLADIEKINFAIKSQNELMLLLKNSITKNNNISRKNIDLKILFKKLNHDKATLISYFSGAKNIYCFAFQNNNLQLLKSENANEPKSVIRQFINYFKDSETILNHVFGYNQIGNLAYQYLKIPKKNASEKLIIIPDGILNFLPFEALITEKSSSTNFAKMHYLLNEFKVGYSNSVLFYMNQKPYSNQKEQILGVFPVFENSPLEISYSKKELENIKANFDGKYLENKNATFENFAKNAKKYSILHLSTHASSGNIDEPASIRFYDKEVLYSELYNIKINPNLVVLSACETGLGKLYKSEGSMSIARGFQFAGAENLLFSLWNVNDYTTSVFMSDFYKKLKNGSSYLDANNQAKLDFLNNPEIPNAKKSPYFWSPMVYYGCVEKKDNFSYLLSSLLGISICIGLLIWLRNKTTYLNKMILNAC